MRRNRRLLFTLSMTLLAGVVSASALAAESDPIRVGFLTIKSGALAAGGKQMEDGLRLFLKERNNMIAGRKVELFVGDTAGQPAVTKTKAQEMVEKNKVQVIIGPLAAFEALAVDDYIRSTETPTISPSAAAEDLTQRKPNPWFVRAVGTSAQPNHPLGDYAAKTLKYKRIAIIADDFAFGHEIAAGFQRAFEDAGGKVVQKLWSPLNVADYGTYIGQIKPDVDAVFAAFAGGNGIKFLKQYNEYGMKAKIPLLGAMTTVDEGVLKSMGDEALGVVSSGWYTAAIDNPNNKRFVSGIRRDYQQDPGLLLGRRLRCRADARRGTQGRQRQDRGQDGVHGGAAQRAGGQRPARHHRPRRPAATPRWTSTSARSSARKAVWSTAWSRSTRRSRSSGPTAAPPS